MSTQALRLRTLRQLIFACFISLVTAQVFAGFHGASYGFADHQHSGHSCVVLHYTKCDKALDAPSFTLFTPQTQLIVFASVAPAAPDLPINRLFNPRAPPIFS